MKHRLRHRPSPATLTAVLALLVAAPGTVLAASKLVSGDKLIKKHSLSANRLRNHTVTGKQVNLAKLGTVPVASRAGSAARADHFFDSGLVTLPALGGSAGNEKPIATIGPFTFIAQCQDKGGGQIFADVLVRDNSANGAVEQDYDDGSTVTTMNPGDSHGVFDSGGFTSPSWFGGLNNMFAVAAPGGPALSGQGAMGVHVLGADCAFQLIVFG